MRVLLVTDAWSPQTNGVVTTLSQVVKRLAAAGHDMRVIHPGLFATLPLPSYPEIRISREIKQVKERIARARADAIHIATEGPLGMIARRYCQRHEIPFTTSLHTKFPEYVEKRVRLPADIGYRFVRRFHAPAIRTLCTTPSHKAELAARGFKNLVVWGRGVDTDTFYPSASRPQSEDGRPRLVYVGRVAVEKNLEAFLAMPFDGHKVVVGDGPARADLQSRYPRAEWLGMLKGEPLRAQFAAADVFVFPSLTDTFGLVMLEALACGTPVAAYPVTGPKDVITTGVNGAIDDDLARATELALQVDRDACRRFALAQSWQQVTDRFLANLVPRSHVQTDYLGAA